MMGNYTSLVFTLAKSFIYFTVFFFWLSKASEYIGKDGKDAAFMARYNLVLALIFTLYYIILR